MATPIASTISSRLAPRPASWEPVIGKASVAAGGNTQRKGDQFLGLGVERARRISCPAEGAEGLHRVGSGCRQHAPIGTNGLVEFRKILRHARLPGSDQESRNGRGGSLIRINAVGRGGWFLRCFPGPSPCPSGIRSRTLLSTSTCRSASIVPRACMRWSLPAVARHKAGSRRALARQSTSGRPIGVLGWQGPRASVRCTEPATGSGNAVFLDRSRQVLGCLLALECIGPELRGDVLVQRHCLGRGGDQRHAQPDVGLFAQPEGADG